MLNKIFLNGEYTPIELLNIIKTELHRYTQRPSKYNKIQPAQFKSSNVVLKF